MERLKIRLFGTGCVLFILCSTWLIFFYNRIEQTTEITIYPDSGFYTGDIIVEIAAKEPVYYTLSGHSPESQGNITEYTGPVTLQAEPDGGAYSLSFFRLSKDGTYSKLADRNYVVTEEGRMLNTDYVICVQGEEEDLFGYEEGIFVRGRRWDEYVAANPEVNPAHVLIPANYYEDKEVPVHAAIFTRAGQEIISQNCGLKIYGRANRAKNQKSFRLISRFSYDDVNEFSYPFFDNLISDNTGTKIQAYQRLSLHNSGQDNGYSFMRNTLCSELARQAGFPDVLVSQSAAVYINNRYMGVYWLQNTFDDRYFSEKYGSCADGEIAVCEGGLNQMEVSEDQDPWDRESAEAYNDFCSWLSGADVNDPAVWQRITETIDIDNLIQYAAIEYYINNQDWPWSNVKVYRYQPDNGEYGDGIFDGRYRYLLFDTDYGFGLIFYGWIGRDAYTEVLKELCDPAQSAMIFAKLMERKECRDSFINEVVNLRNGSFSAENVNRQLDLFNSTRWDELVYMMEQTDILKNSVWEPDDNNPDNVIEEMQVIRKFADVRGSRVLTEIMHTWDCGTLFQAETETPVEIQLCINGQEVTEDSWYFAGIPLTLSANADSGIKVTGYEVNGTYIDGDTVELSAEQYLIGEEKLHIMPVYEYAETTELSIHSFSVSGTQDYVILKNTGTTNIYLKDYFLSDDADHLLKGRLPDVVLAPGAFFTVYGGKYDSQMEEESFQVDFSWSKEEPVILAHLTDGAIECRNYYKNDL